MGIRGALSGGRLRVAGGLGEGVFIGVGGKVVVKKDPPRAKVGDNLWGAGGGGRTYQMGGAGRTHVGKEGVLVRLGWKKGRPFGFRRLD